MIEKFKTNAEVIENGDKYLYGNHVRMPISMERGEGVYVFDKDGNKYLDFVGGIAVNGLGHCHPAIVKCLQERAETILHCSNYFYNEPAVQTAKLIVENSCFDKLPLCQLRRRGQRRPDQARPQVRQGSRPSRALRRHHDEELLPRPHPRHLHRHRSVCRPPLLRAPALRLPLCRVQQPPVRQGHHG